MCYGFRLMVLDYRLLVIAHMFKSITGILNE